RRAAQALDKVDREKGLRQGDSKVPEGRRQGVRRVALFPAQRGKPAPFSCLGRRFPFHTLAGAGGLLSLRGLRRGVCPTGRINIRVRKQAKDVGRSSATQSGGKKGDLVAQRIAKNAQDQARQERSAQRGEVNQNVAVAEVRAPHAPGNHVGHQRRPGGHRQSAKGDRKSTRLNSSHVKI